MWALEIGAEKFADRETEKADTLASSVWLRDTGYLYLYSLMTDFNVRNKLDVPGAVYSRAIADVERILTLSPIEKLLKMPEFPERITASIEADCPRGLTCRMDGKHFKYVYFSLSILLYQ
jgi:hypothetical protein